MQSETISTGRPNSSTDAKTQSSSETPRKETQRPPERGPMTDAQRAERVAELMGLAPAPERAAPATGADEGATDQDGDDPGRDDPWRPQESAGEGAEGGADGAKGGKPATLAEAAERLGIEPAAMYDLSINTGDGETVTLGAIKDAWQDRNSIAREGAKKAMELDARESELVAREAFYSRVQNELAQRLTPQMRSEIAGRFKAEQARHREALLRAMPELSDPAVMTSFLEQLGQEFEGHGFRPGEIQMLDHRVALMARDLMRAKARIARWAAYEPDQQPIKSRESQGRKDAGGNRTKAIMQRARTGNTADKVAAVGALIKGS
jgi:hypothetical protein